MNKFLLTCCFLFVFPCIVLAETTLKIGTMPAADSILLYVGAEEKIFEKYGLNLEIIPFQSAIELGAAMRSGTIDGYFTCIINAVLQHLSGTPQTIVATTSYARPDQRHFGLVVSPQKNINSLEELRGKTVAVGKDTIVDFLLTQFLASRNLADTYIERQDIRSIAMRLQLLMAGQLDTALLPEPLVSTLEARGAKVLLDDTNLRLPLAVISFAREKLTKEIYTHFRQALDESADLINANPEKYKDTMLKYKLLSADAKKAYSMLTFAKENTPCYLPTEQELDLYFTWLYDRKLINIKPLAKDILPEF